jgi:hypothetical protein
VKKWCLKDKGMGVSECASEDVDDTDEGGGIPFDGDSAVDLVVPEARSRDVEPAVSFLHDDAVCDELEVLVDSRDILENLNRQRCTSSQIWLVHSWASLTL